MTFEIILSASIGAFLTFLFVIIGSVIERIYERQNTYYNALVRLEQLLGVYTNDISDNIFVVKNLVQGMELYIKDGTPVILMNVFIPFSINFDITLDLHNLDLINEFFSYNIDLNKMNRSMETLNRTRESIQSAFASKVIEEPTYRVNLGILIRNAEELEKFLESLTEKTISLSAKTRVLLKKKTAISIVAGKLIGTHYTAKQIADFPKEKERLEAEMKEIFETSKKEIDETLRR